MLENVLSILKNVIEACFFWWDQLSTATGTTVLIIGVFSLVVMTRLLIVPILGGRLRFGGSDRVRKSKSDDNDEDS